MKAIERGLGERGLQFLLASLGDHAAAAGGAEPASLSPVAGAAALSVCHIASDRLGLAGHGSALG